MKTIIADSRIEEWESDYKLAEALCGVIEQRDHFERACSVIWPGCDIYKGGTHWRLFPYNAFGNKRTSIYIEL